MLKIRPASQNDATALLLVRRDAVFSKAGSYYDQAILEAWLAGATPDLVARIEQEISDPKFIVLVAEAENKIIGFVMAIPTQNELRAVYVKPNSIGKVGKALLDEVEKQAFNAGAVFLACDSSMNAEGFYKANGYVEIGRADHTFPNGSKIPSVQLKKLRPSV